MNRLLPGIFFGVLFGAGGDGRDCLGCLFASGGKALGELLQKAIRIVHRVLPAFHRTRHIFDKPILCRAIQQGFETRDGRCGRHGRCVVAKSLAEVRVGDTITLDNDPATEALEGYEEPKQMVYCDFYPATDDEGTGKRADFESLREAMEKLHINDASFTYEVQHSEALGFGFRVGFLGLLHMDIVQERLEREGGVNIIQTAPTVSYQVMKLDGTLVEIHNPADLPDMGVVAEIREPIVKIEIICPNDNIGDLMKLCDARRGCFQSQMAIGEDRQMLIYELPLAEIIYDFYDKLKSVTRGYGTMDYEIIAFRADNLVKVQILVNGDAVEALAMICHRENADQRSRSILAKLKGQIDRHQFEIPLQAAIGGKIIARESIKSMRKNVIAKCYGGDISRKRKLLEKQKAGKKRMKQIGSVSIPQEAFMAILDQGD